MRGGFYDERPWKRAHTLCWVLLDLCGDAIRPPLSRLQLEPNDMALPYPGCGRRCGRRHACQISAVLRTMAASGLSFRSLKRRISTAGCSQCLFSPESRLAPLASTMPRYYLNSLSSLKLECMYLPSHFHTYNKLHCCTILVWNWYFQLLPPRKIHWSIKQWNHVGIKCQPVWVLIHAQKLIDQ